MLKKQTSTSLCCPPGAPRSPTGLVATMIVALMSTACLAVLVVEEDEPNGQGSHEEGEKSNEALLACLGCLVDPGHALGRGNLKVDATAIGQDHAGFQVGEILRQDDKHADQDAETGDEIEAERRERLESSLLRVCEHDEVRDLLRDLVVHGGGMEKKDRTAPELSRRS